jgi:hypothetical protein
MHDQSLSCLDHLSGSQMVSFLLNQRELNRYGSDQGLLPGLHRFRLLNRPVSTIIKNQIDDGGDQVTLLARVGLPSKKASRRKSDHSEWQ